MNAREYVHGHTYDPRLFQAFADIVTARIDGKEHAPKRPSTAMRFVIDDWNTLNIKPEIKSSPTGWIMGDHIRVELRNTVIFAGKKGNGRGIILKLLPDGTIKPRKWWRDADKTRAEMEMIKDYLGKLSTDPQSTISRNVTHCAICGRGFTDPESMARGIGPECSKFFNFLVQYAHGRIENG
jgi:hypothetical protein